MCFFFICLNVVWSGFIYGIEDKNVAALCSVNGQGISFSPDVVSLHVSIYVLSPP